MASPSSTSPTLSPPPPPLLPSPDGFLERPGAVYVRRVRKPVPPTSHAILVPPPPPQTSALPPPPPHPAAAAFPFASLNSHPAALLTPGSSAPPATAAAASAFSTRSPSSSLLGSLHSPLPSASAAVTGWTWSSWSLPPSLRFLFRAVAVFGVLLGVLVAIRYALYLRERSARRAQRLRRERERLTAAQSGASSPTSLTFASDCPHCVLHQQQLQLLRRLCQLIAARLARLQGTAAGAAVDRRKQRLLVSPVVAYTESEAAVVALTEQLEEASTALGAPSASPAHQQSHGSEETGRSKRKDSG